MIPTKKEVEEALKPMCSHSYAIEKYIEVAQVYISGELVRKPSELDIRMILNSNADNEYKEQAILKLLEDKW